MLAGRLRFVNKHHNRHMEVVGADKFYVSSLVLSQETGYQVLLDRAFSIKPSFVRQAQSAPKVSGFSCTTREHGGVVSSGGIATRQASAAITGKHSSCTCSLQPSEQCTCAGWFTCIFGFIASAGIGQAIVICGNFGPNFSACYTCHAREKIRRCTPLPSCVQSSGHM